MSVSRAAAISEAVYIDSMTEHDLLEVVEIEERFGLSRWGWAAYYSELQSHNRKLMLVARIAQRVNSVNANLAGYIVARLSADELHINNVAVRAEFRRQGIGSCLLRRILEIGKSSAATEALLEVRAGNSAAQALYERCGLRVIGRRRNYYSEPVEDALVMSLGFE
jgi:ribosomal-protein-alanine N-acetyltransferase